MNHQITFLYLACQTCQAKIHCEQCGEDVTNSLLQMGGVDSVALNMVAKTLTVSGNISSDDLEMKLEDFGFLID